MRSQMEPFKEFNQESDTQLDACIKCSACTVHCPVTAVYPLFPGPKSIGPDMERLRLEQVWLDPSLLEYCSNCKTCEITCPSGVKITEMILKAREDSQVQPRKSSLRHKLRDRMLGRAEYLGIIGTTAPRLVNAVLGRSPVRWLMEKSLGISRQAPLPKYQPRFQAAHREGFKVSPANSKKVVYFPGCFINYNDSRTGEAVIKVLQHNGYEVIVPPFHCCGVPLRANGNFRGAEANAQKNLALLTPYLRMGLPIITSCTSCGLALKEDYPRMKAEGAKIMGQQTYDLFEFLWELHERGEFKKDFTKVLRSFGYHAPCHLKAQGIGTPSVRLLRLIPGVEVEELDAGCCGLSGSYEFKEEKYSLAMQIGNPVFERVQEGVRNGKCIGMLTECGGCKVQLEHGTGVRTEHPVWTLFKAYNLELNA